MRRLFRDGPVLAMMGGQIIVWAALFYTFPALVLDWQEEFGWSSAQSMGAFTVASGLYALGLPLYGRLIDRGFAPRTFPLGALGGAALLVALTFTESLAGFYAIWALMGICMGLTLYEPCFALVTRARGARARPAITAITLVAGFASTLAYPLTHWVTEAAGDWRAAVYVMAALVLVVNLPLAAFASHRLEAEARGQAETEAGPAAPAPHLLRNPRYWPLAMGFALAALTSGIFLSHLLPMMAAQGVPDGLAVIAAAVIGPSQVAGRLLMMGTEGRAAAILVAQVAMLCLSLGALAMAGAAALPMLVLGACAIYGAGYGVVGILRAVVTREVLGQRNYGAIAGAVSLPSLLASSLAPFVAATLADLGGYGPVILLALLAPIAGAALLLVTRRQM